MPSRQLHVLLVDLAKRLTEMSIFLGSSEISGPKITARVLEKIKPASHSLESDILAAKFY